MGGIRTVLLITCDLRDWHVHSAHAVRQCASLLFEG